MICPVCGFENIQGQDECENCGADLRTADIPSPGSTFEQLLLDEPLSVVGAIPPLTVSPEASLAETVRQMQERVASCVVVEEDGQVKGILTERDLLLRTSGSSLDDQRVGELMTPDPVILRPEDSVAVAIHKMAVGGFRHVPLVENGHATGIVSAADLFRYILKIVG